MAERGEGKLEMLNVAESANLDTNAHSVSGEPLEAYMEEEVLI